MSDIKEVVRERYAKSAVTLPHDETPPSLGLGDPVELAKLQPGETVLDLGSGPGRDLLAAARAVGASGRAIGVDMTAEMIERARASAREAGLDNVTILDGDLEKLPLHCGAVDVVISNCVINLVPDKKRALIEAYRALRPGGRLAILDTAFDADPGEEVRNDADAWCGCSAGALVREDYEALLNDIGYEQVETRWMDDGSGCGTTRSLAVTAVKNGDAQPAVRPAVPSDLVRIPWLADHRIEDAIVLTDEPGAIVLERWGSVAVIRKMEPADKRLLVAAVEVARWSGADEVRAEPHDVYKEFGFVPAGMQVKLNWEESNLPLISKPSLKPLPTFQDGTCC